MGKMGLVFLLFLFSLSNFPQTLFFEENFEYDEGNLTTLTSNWTENPNGTVDIQVITGSLSFANYPSSGNGNKIVVNGGATGRSGILRTFIPQSSDGSKVYASFLINVTSTTDMDINTSNGDRFFNLKVSGSSSFRACVFVKQGSTTENFQIGLGKLNASTPSWYSSELYINTVYLIVVAYIFQSGNDAVRFWINPSLTGEEQIADLEQTVGLDASDIGEIQFRQQPLSGDLEIDGIRVADNWSEAPLPVELSSFAALAINNQIHLNWSTATEVSNYGFEVERAINNPQSEIRNTQFVKIGFVKGYGNSNSVREYSFIDNDVSYGTYLYRLKQIDTDGKFEYSQTIETNLDIQLNYALEQNYPNPFNPVTKIKYQIPEEVYVTLKVFDILGNELATLVSKNQPEGIYEVPFDASSVNGGLSSGIYFYQLKANNFSSIKKLIVIK